MTGQDEIHERVCSRIGCSGPAVVTITYDYRDSLVAVGPLSPVPDPHGYDLCSEHDRRLLVPRGWETIRYSEPSPPTAG
ncbi:MULTISPECIES: DUF3499 family protein [unclassified Rathayibacter]|uniref:DUF3499 family protein n=1 Tax=unclassified Rathayibacter TaxID=2609250 RepID=UPI0006F9DDD5|nr:MULTISPECIES: DUF3499 family protein [unclassified Rathayibacter]KQP97576.1 hypothetical protein ASF42_18030 [Rathayibacter sp. Leaf294]KQS07248.1 hypothetical protein ASG06_18765 [Rathayibacter sp. Leaf185]